MLAPILLAFTNVHVTQRTAVGIRLGRVAFFQFDVIVEIVSDRFGATRALLIFVLVRAFAK